MQQKTIKSYSFLKDKDFLERYRDDPETLEFYRKELANIYTLMYARKGFLYLRIGKTMYEALHSLTIKELIDATMALDFGSRSEIEEYFKVFFEDRNEDDKTL